MTWSALDWEESTSFPRVPFSETGVVLLCLHVTLDEGKGIGFPLMKREDCFAWSEFHDRKRCTS